METNRDRNGNCHSTQITGSEFRNRSILCCISICIINTGVVTKRKRSDQKEISLVHARKYFRRTFDWSIAKRWFVSSSDSAEEDQRRSAYRTAHILLLTDKTTNDVSFLVLPEKSSTAFVYSAGNRWWKKELSHVPAIRNGWKIFSPVSGWTMA